MGRKITKSPNLSPLLINVLGCGRKGYLSYKMHQIPHFSTVLIEKCCAGLGIKNGVWTLLATKNKKLSRQFKSFSCNLIRSTSLTTSLILKLVANLATAGKLPAASWTILVALTTVSFAILSPAVATPSSHLSEIWKPNGAKLTPKSCLGLGGTNSKKHAASHYDIDLFPAV